MRIVFFTSEKFISNEVFLYMFARVANSFDDVLIVAVQRSTSSLLDRYRSKLRRIWRFGTGITNTLELLSSYPIQRYVIRRSERRAQAGIRALPRPSVNPRPQEAIYVETVNGFDAVEAISKLKPDVVIQFDAGILEKQIFGIARIGTLNLHPGIAPLIKGRDPIYWALWEQEPKWLGATVHFIDEGIDTGPVLAYAPVAPLFPGESHPDLFVRVYKLGIDQLIDTLSRLAQGERWAINPLQGERIYRSNISGWKLGLVETRDALRRLLYSASQTLFLQL
jgi:methionyl-tRNA formyltransferase